MKLTAADRKALQQRYGKYWAMADEKTVKQPDVKRSVANRDKK